MSDRLYPLFTYLIRNTYPLGLGKFIHFVFKKLKLLSNPMNSKGQMLSSDLIFESFKNLDQNLSHRRAVANIYAKLIDSSVISNRIAKQIPLSSNLRFPIFVEDRNSLINYLEKNGVFISDIWYDAPVAPNRFLKLTDYTNQCPNSEIISQKILNLPTHLNTSEKDAEKIAQLVNKFANSQVH